MVKVPTLAFLNRRKNESPTELPVSPMTLVSAVFLRLSALQLTFNRAIDPSDVLPDGFSVIDGDVQLQFVGTSYYMIDPTTIAIELVETGGAIGMGIKLYADASNGIKAVGDGAAWDGVSGLELPFS